MLYQFSTGTGSIKAAIVNYVRPKLFLWIRELESVIWQAHPYPLLPYGPKSQLPCTSCRHTHCAKWFKMVPDWFSSDFTPTLLSFCKVQANEDSEPSFVNWHFLCWSDDYFFLNGICALFSQTVAHLICLVTGWLFILTTLYINYNCLIYLFDRLKLVCICELSISHFGFPERISIRCIPSE